MALLALSQLALAGCRARVLYTEHPQVLVERRGDSYAQLDEDDPRYERLAAYLAADLALERLLHAYNSTTAAFAASGLRSEARVAVVNNPVIVLGANAGLLCDILVQGVYDDVTIEFALGVPEADLTELSTAAPGLARTIGEALMLLAGRDQAATCEGADDDILARTLGAALEAWYVAETEVAHAAMAGKIESMPEEGGCLDMEAAFMQRLFAAPKPGYPQRYMLWFANYQARDEGLAKILLAANRLSRKATLEDFANAYATAFPGERERVAELVADLLGSCAWPTHNDKHSER
jgi:hypothetical protein